MIICGLKLTHDGSIALLEDGSLKALIEMEKLESKPRYESIESVEQIESVLQSCGINIDDVDHFVVDGWGGYQADSSIEESRLGLKDEYNELAINVGSSSQSISVLQYIERKRLDDVLHEKKFEGFKFSEKEVPYSSFLHVTGHIMSAYCTSPFSEAGTSAYVLVWDGGMNPHLYYVSRETNKIINMGPLFFLIGNVYSVFSQHFGPFAISSETALDDLSIAGKVMAYAAFGKDRKDLYPLFDKLCEHSYSEPMNIGNVLAKGLKQKALLNDEDSLATFQGYLEHRLIKALAKRVSRFPDRKLNLCLAGGCALNIVWNSAIREAGTFDTVYVPPFPNDSGSAMGQACAKYFVETGQTKIDWNVYAGPPLDDSEAITGWQSQACSVQELAHFLNKYDEPVVVLNGNAEVGPRALGNRSIIAHPFSEQIKDRLNEMKKREPYRPVAPICLEQDAHTIFTPGSSDPFMLFNHMVKDEWRDRVPAIMHLDGSARLQTVSQDQNELIYELLTAFKEISGVPLLCNTSANENGKGFFPGLQAASSWSAARFIWCDQLMYKKQNVGEPPLRELND